MVGRGRKDRLKEECLRGYWSGCGVDGDDLAGNAGVKGLEVG